jgi:hypothetical protein
LVRLDDTGDKSWTSSLGYIEVRAVAHYLSTHGTSVAGIGTTPANFQTFPIGTELSPDNVVVGPALPGDVVSSDYVAGKSFLNVDVGTDPFAFLYRSEGKTYSSNNFAGNGFANGNGGALDHMASWYAGEATDLQGNNAAVYLIAFERQNKDLDFQDGVYEVRIPIAPVPEPSTFALLAAGVGLAGWAKMRRRAKN